MPIRDAACSCGQLRLTCDGDPVRVSMCHCLACQRRTGSAFGVQAWFTREQVRPEGESKRFVRRAESGRAVTFSFCPECGSTVFWEAEADAGMIKVAVGAFADPTFPPPRHSYWERRRHPWTLLPGEVPMERSD